MRWRRYLLSAPAVVGLLACAAPAQAAWPGLNGRIALTQRTDTGAGEQLRPNREIFAYARDGSRANLTNSRENDEQSSWSPDGRWFAFKRRDAVFVQPLDGRPAWALTTPGDGAINNTQPAWSPDARSIVFRTNRSNAPLNVADIWVMDAPSA